VSFLGRYWGGGGSLGAVIIGCVVYGFQYGLGVRGLWVSIFDVFWVLFGVVVLGGVFWPQVSIVCLCAWLGVFGIYWKWLLLILSIFHGKVA